LFKTTQSEKGILGLLLAALKSGGTCFDQSYHDRSSLGVYLHLPQRESNSCPKHQFAISIRRANQTFGKTLCIADEFFDNLGAKRDAADERMAVEGEELRRARFAFPLEIVELVLHDLQEVARRAAGA